MFQQLLVFWPYMGDQETITRKTYKTFPKKAMQLPNEKVKTSQGNHLAAASFGEIIEIVEARFVVRKQDG
ncbi:hypothetical protein ACOSQ3_012835 [Xanthoceras sorbifolium]